MTPDEGPSLKTSIFSLSFQVVRARTFTFRVTLNTLPTLATLVHFEIGSQYDGPQLCLYD